VKLANRLVGWLTSPILPHKFPLFFRLAKVAQLNKRQCWKRIIKNCSLEQRSWSVPHQKSPPLFASAATYVYWRNV
jgi:hypothetical protein